MGLGVKIGCQALSRCCLKAVSAYPDERSQIAASTSYNIKTYQQDAAAHPISSLNQVQNLAQALHYRRLSWGFA